MRKPKRQVDYATRDSLAKMYRADRKRGRRPSHISSLLDRAKARRETSKATRRAKRPIQLQGGRNAADTIRLMRRVSRGGKLTAKEKKNMGPMVFPSSPLTGAAGAKAWNAFAKSGYRAWETRKQKYGPSGRGKTAAKKKR